MPVTVSMPVPLRERADIASVRIADLQIGDTFEVLELAGNNAWGIACTLGLVGYIDAIAISGTPA